MIIADILLTLRYMKVELVFSSLFIICLFFLDYQLYMKGHRLISFDLEDGGGRKGAGGGAFSVLLLERRATLSISLHSAKLPHMFWRGREFIPEYFISLMKMYERKEVRRGSMFSTEKLLISSLSSTSKF